MQYSSLEEAFYDYSPKESTTEYFSTLAPVVPVLTSVKPELPNTQIITPTVPCEHCVITRRKSDKNSALILVLFFLLILLALKR